MSNFSGEIRPKLARDMVINETDVVIEGSRFQKKKKTKFVWKGFHISKVAQFLDETVK